MSARGNTGWRVCIRMTVTYFYIVVEYILQANDVTESAGYPINLYHSTLICIITLALFISKRYSLAIIMFTFKESVTYLQLAVRGLLKVHS